MRQRDGLIRGAAAIVGTAAVANRLFFVALVAGLVATWLVPGFFAGLLDAAGPAADAAAALAGIRLLMAIGVVMAVAIDRLLVALGTIVAAAAMGDPFAPENARRLRTIGWALLTLQLLDIPCTLLARF